MPKSLKRFDYDNWTEVSSNELKAGDIFSYGNTTAVFNGTTQDEAGRLIINADPLDQGPIHLCLGGPGWDYIARAMDSVGSGCESFNDGTAIITEFEKGNVFVYSPRLPESELNEFCRVNISHYEAFYDSNAEAIDDGRRIEMQRFW